VKKIRWWIPALAIVLCAGLWLGYSYYEMRQPRLFTAAAQVTGLAVADDGAVWAATKGGVIRWRAGKAAPELWTAANDLPANEVRAVAPDREGAWIITAADLCRIAPDGALTLCPLPDAGELRDLIVADGACYMATSAGVYARKGESFRRVLDCDARRLAELDEDIWVAADTYLLRLRDGERRPLPDALGNMTGLDAAGGRLYLATALGLWSFDGDAWSEIPLPASSRGSHVSALAGDGNSLLAGIYGDGLYRFDGGRWTAVQAPDSFRRVTALAQGPQGWLAGADGLWERRDDTWRQIRMPDALPTADVYGIVEYRRALWIATFDRGLLCRRKGAWRAVGRADGLSGDSPRDLLVFAGRLYTRHSTGEVDCFDGRAWRPAFSKTDLPRQGVYSMAVDGKRLYLGMWAGWASTDGRSWEHHFKEPALRDQVITAIAAQGNTVWLGTQKAGLFAWRNGELRQYHEAHGLTDDWITRLAVRGDRLLVGTYTGGLLERRGERFARVMSAEGFAIRDIAFTAEGGALVATPLGVYREEGADWRLLDPRTCGGLEVQTLYPMQSGTWIGTRTALAFLPG